MTRAAGDDVTAPADASVPVEISVPDAGQMPGRLWLPPSGRGPGLLLLQEIFGVSQYIRRRGADLAAAGYVVLAPELYWRLDATPIDESGPGAIEEAMARAQQLDWPTTVQDAVAALHHLSSRDEISGGTGVIGFCFGGGLAFNVAAVDEVDALVSYYGSALPGLLDLAPQVSAPSLHHFGTADDFIDTATVARIREAVTKGGTLVEFETYEGANHAFDNDRFGLHHPEASKVAWPRTLDFLARTLPVD
ncbi:MAG TPA: dienelactone hydrolase family protein [Kineosporiaceae bacterium]|nr:dienelactone hydrolase family protein [Kineosporiaceae bacterium]